MENILEEIKKPTSKNKVLELAAIACQNSETVKKLIDLSFSKDE